MSCLWWWRLPLLLALLGATMHVDAIPHMLLSSGSSHSSNNGGDSDSDSQPPSQPSRGMFEHLRVSGHKQRVRARQIARPKMAIDNSSVNRLGTGTYCEFGAPSRMAGTRRVPPISAANRTRAQGPIAVSDLVERRSAVVMTGISLAASALEQHLDTMPDGRRKACMQQWCLASRELEVASNRIVNGVMRPADASSLGSSIVTNTSDPPTSSAGSVAGVGSRHGCSATQARLLSGIERAGARERHAATSADAANANFNATISSFQEGNRLSITTSLKDMAAEVVSTNTESRIASAACLDAIDGVTEALWEVVNQLRGLKPCCAGHGNVPHGTTVDASTGDALSEEVGESAAVPVVGEDTPGSTRKRCRGRDCDSCKREPITPSREGSIDRLIPTEVSQPRQSSMPIEIVISDDEECGGVETITGCPSESYPTRQPCSSRTNVASRSTSSSTAVIKPDISTSSSLRLNMGTPVLTRGRPPSSSPSSSPSVPSTSSRLLTESSSSVRPKVVAGSKWKQQKRMYAPEKVKYVVDYLKVHNWGRLHEIGKLFTTKRPEWTMKQYHGNAYKALVHEHVLAAIKRARIGKDRILYDTFINEGVHQYKWVSDVLEALLPGDPKPKIYGKPVFYVEGKVTKDEMARIIRVEVDTTNMRKKDDELSTKQAKADVGLKPKPRTETRPEDIPLVKQGDTWPPSEFDLQLIKDVLNESDDGVTKTGYMALVCKHARAANMPLEAVQSADFWLWDGDSSSSTPSYAVWLAAEKEFRSKTSESVEESLNVIRIVCRHVFLSPRDRGIQARLVQILFE
eukprot:GHVU01018441.1.p1 GENE.GHVU01018441.1~~GHVU01018441.1.p1  ORF type:complete len:803 (+),score=55.83 GHVU01018441.1:207-2615(+)